MKKVMVVVRQLKGHDPVASACFITDKQDSRDFCVESYLNEYADDHIEAFTEEFAEFNHDNCIWTKNIVDAKER